MAYNSEKWIERCFSSLGKSEYDLKKINVYVVDNGSTDHTVEKLYQTKEKMQGQLGEFQVIESKENLGFGRGNNLGFSKGNSDLVCFFNMDTEVLPDTLTELANAVQHSDADVALWELRQFPYEHPKLYDAVTMEGLWSSGAAFAIVITSYPSLLASIALTGSISVTMTFAPSAAALMAMPLLHHP